MTTRQKFREMVICLLKGKFVEDDEVIESYTDSLMFGAEEYSKSQKSAIPIVSDTLGYFKKFGDIYYINEIDGDMLTGWRLTPKGMTHRMTIAKDEVEEFVESCS